MRRRRRPGLDLAWVVFVACGIVLALGPRFLLGDVPGMFGLPWGTLLAAVGFVAAGLAGWMAAPIGSPLRVVGALALANALVWLPVSIAIAGNVRLVFSNQPERSQLWFGYTLLTGVAVLVLAVIGRFRRSRDL